jgi:hypothetical protein
VGTCWGEGVTRTRDKTLSLNSEPQVTKPADLLTGEPVVTCGLPRLVLIISFDKGENDNEDVILLKENHFRSLQIRALVEWNPALDEQIFDTLAWECRERLDEFKGWTKNDQELWEYQGRLYVPRDVRLRQQILAAHHNSLVAGHPGEAKTCELLLRNYWWPDVTKDIKTYVTGCTTCQRVKPT